MFAMDLVWKHWSNIKDFCKEFTAWHYATKWAAVKFVIPWMSRHFSSESRDPSCIGSASVQNDPVKTGGAIPASYTNGNAARRSENVQVKRRHLRPCLVLSWCGADRRTIWDCCWPWGVSSPLMAAAPATPRGKTGMETNEWIVWATLDAE